LFKKSVRNKDLKWLTAADSLAKIFSTCSRKKYCAIILSPTGRVAGMGYNGAPSGMKHCEDGGCPRAFMDVEHGSNYENCIAIHAEANALLWSDQFMREGGTLVVNGPPCYNCAKLICNSAVKSVVCYRDELYSNFKQVTNIFNDSGIELRIYDR
jgi:dCMP deaminase